MLDALNPQKDVEKTKKELPALAPMNRRIRYRFPLKFSLQTSD